MQQIVYQVYNRACLNPYQVPRYKTAVTFFRPDFFELVWGHFCDTRSERLASITASVVSRCVLCECSTRTSPCPNPSQYEEDVLQVVLGRAESPKEVAFQDSIVALVALPGYFVAVALIGRMGPRRMQVTYGTAPHPSALPCAPSLPFSVIVASEPGGVAGALQRALLSRVRCVTAPVRGRMLSRCARYDPP